MNVIRLSLLTVVMACAVSLAAEPSAGKIVYPRQEGSGFRLHVMDLDGKNDREIPGQIAAVNVLPAWSPDGKRIAFMTAAVVDATEHQVAVVNVDGSGLLTLPSPSQRAGLAGWSPDGSQLLFSAGNMQPELYVSDITGSSARRLSPEGMAGLGGFWLSGGKQIGYTRFSQDRKGHIVQINPDGTGESVLISVDGLPIAGPNAVSSDGKRLAYVVYDLEAMKASLRIWEFESKSELFLGDLDSSLRGFEKFPMPSWMPDGKALLVAAKTDKGHALFRVPTDGQPRTRLTPEGIDCLGGAVFAGK